jgi:hypothetical protein
MPTTVATVALTNVIDSGPLGGQNTIAPVVNAGRDFGMGYPVWLYMLIIAAPTSGGSATIDAQLVSSAAANLSSPNVMLDLTGGAQAYNGGLFAAATAYRFALPRFGPYVATINPNGWLRYIGINWIVGTAALTGSGKVCAFLTRDIQDNVLYQAGYTLS